jgi:hypothetical protein
LELVWRTRRTLAGVELGSAWVDVAGDEPARAQRVLVGRLSAVQQWERVAGCELVPRCARCASLLVWRGAWQCVGCSERQPLRGANEVPRALPREALAGAGIFSSQEGNNSTARSTWLAGVEALTSFHRRSVAARLRVRGARKAREVVDTLTGEVTSSGGPWLARWHAQRMLGQAERFERVRECGAFEYALDVTSADGTTATRPLRKRCDCWRVCRRCMDRRKWKLGEGMKAQRELVMRRHSRQIGRFYAGKEGKWSEKLITFTVPHGPGGPAKDARVLVDAWQQLLRRLRRHLVVRGGLQRGGARARASAGAVKSAALSFPWCRALEVASGDTGGHAHLHVWFVGPFIDHVLLRHWWGQVLREAGVEGVPTRAWSEVRGAARDRRLGGWLGNPAESAQILWPVVDIRAGSDAAASYIQKVGVSLYVTKGTEVHALAPVHAASIYEVFEGVRAVQWAKGWAPPKAPAVSLCVVFRRLTDEEKRVLNDSALTARSEAKNAEKTAQKSNPLDIPPPLRAARDGPVAAAALPLSQLHIVFVE